MVVAFEQNPYFEGIFRKGVKYFEMKFDSLNIF